MTREYKYTFNPETIGPINPYSKNNYVAVIKMDNPFDVGDVVDFLGQRLYSIHSFSIAEDGSISLEGYLK